MAVRTLVESDSLSVLDYVCTAQVGDRPFPEQHGGYSISYVRSGSFGYRSLGKSFELVAGSVMLGHLGDEYLCTHEHSCGDECLSFHLKAEGLARLGAEPEVFRAGALPPVPELVVVGELGQAAAAGGSDVGLDEVCVLMAAKVLEVIGSRAPKHEPMAARDRRGGVRSSV